MLDIQSQIMHNVCSMYVVMFNDVMLGTSRWDVIYQTLLDYFRRRSWLARLSYYSIHVPRPLPVFLCYMPLRKAMFSSDVNIDQLMNEWNPAELYRLSSLHVYFAVYS